MGYVPLNNYKYDSGYRRIQSGPNNQGFIVLTSGSSAYGVNEGIVVPGSPLSGNLINGVWDYDSNWRYVPITLPNQSGSLDPTPYNASGALDTYKAARIYTRDNVAGAQAASAIGPETGKINPRGAALQPRANVTRPEKYMYYGGGAPDNQDYSPYNTPDANTAAEGKTGGGVTHRNYESSLLTNLLGSQGTSDRSQWRYHEPVYCKTFTETQRSSTPGLMSSPLRYVYRGSATSYTYNYAGELLANKGGFAPLNYDEFGGGCDFPPPCPTTTGGPLNPQPGDVLRGSSFCTYVSITWYNTGSNELIGTGDTYTIQESDYFHKIYYVVTYPNGSSAASSTDCLERIVPPGYGTYWVARLGDSWRTASFKQLNPSITVDIYGNCYLAWQRAAGTGTTTTQNAYLYVQKRNNKGEEVWTKEYGFVPTFYDQRVIPVLDPTNTTLFVGWGGFFRRPGPSFDRLQPSLELFKIDAKTGNLIQHHYYIFVGPSATYSSTAFTRIQYDAYSNKIVAFLRNFFLAQFFLIDPDNLNITTNGFSFFETGTLDSLRTIEDAMVIRPQENPDNTFVVTVDNGNRYIWWETDTLFRGTTGASGLRYGPTTTFTYNNPLRATPISVTFSGQEHFVSANHELTAGTLVVWNKNRQPVLKTSQSAGFPVGFMKDPTDPSSIYVALTNASPSQISGILARGNSTFAIAKYTPQTNRLETYSVISVLSGVGTNINGDSSRAAQFGCPENLNSNIEYVNRGVFAYYNDNLDNAAIPSGLNSLFVMGASLVASGSYRPLDWNNTAGYSGFFEATDKTNKDLGAAALPTLSTPFTNAGGSYGPHEKGSTYISGSVIDITGTITEAYGYDSFD